MLVKEGDMRGWGGGGEKDDKSSSRVSPPLNRDGEGATDGGKDREARCTRKGRARNKEISKLRRIRDYQAAQSRTRRFKRISRNKGTRGMTRPVGQHLPVHLERGERNNERAMFIEGPKRKKKEKRLQLKNPRKNHANGSV